MLAGFGSPSPVFELALAALEADPPPPRKRVTVHGDLRLGNLIVGPEALHAVIDWEQVHAGNPGEDLGWLCVKAWRFGAAPAGRRPGLSGRSCWPPTGPRAEPTSAWPSCAGGRSSARCAGAIICMNQAQAHLSGAHRSVELAAIGRRVCEQEWDLLLLLDPDAAAAAAARRPRPSGQPQPSPAPHGRPTASELLDAVRGYLTDQSCRAPAASCRSTPGSPPTCWPSSPASSNWARCRPAPPRGPGGRQAGRVEPRYFGDG